MTTKDIAKMCNVSTATVSNILNGKGKASEQTVKMVMEVVEKYNYKPNYIAQGLRRKITNTIGIVAEDISQFTTPDILEGVMEECEKAGYRVIVENLRFYARWKDRWYDSDVDIQSKLAPAIDELKAVRVDGAVYIAGHAREIKGFSEKLDIPNVVAYAYSEHENTSSVMIDDVLGGYEMTKYLISMGHRKIAFIGGRRDNMHTIRRLEGYQKAIFENSLLFNPNLVKYTDWSREEAYLKMQELENEEFTAVFCISDKMCGGVYDLLEERGLVAGKDISVAGYDDSEIAAYFRPGLTTMAINLKEIGRVAARKLIDEMNGKEGVGEKVYVPCHIVERKSIARIGK